MNEFLVITFLSLLLSFTCRPSRSSGYSYETWEPWMEFPWKRSQRLEALWSQLSYAEMKEEWGESQQIHHYQLSHGTVTKGFLLSYAFSRRWLLPVVTYDINSVAVLTARVPRSFLMVPVGARCHNRRLKHDKISGRKTSRGKDTEPTSFHSEDY